MTEHYLTLSTTEPNNNIGIVKLRHADVNSQAIVAQIVENGQPKSFEGLQPFFCLMAQEVTGQGVSEEVVQTFNANKGTLEYMASDNALQMVGRNEAYFSFRKQEGGRWIEQFSTRTFHYIVEKSIYSQPFKDSNYWWTFKELYRIFNQYIEDGKKSWEEFVEANREILESIDPGGKILEELIYARNYSSDTDFKTLGERLNSIDDKLLDIPLDEAKKIFAFNSNQFLEAEEFVPSYYQRRLQELSETLKDNQFNILHFTDCHHQLSNYVPNSLKHAGYASNLTKKAPINALVANGDNTNGWFEKPQMLIETNQITSTLFHDSSFDTDVFFNLGNHDTGASFSRFNTPEETITFDELKAFYQTKTCVNDEIREDDSFYAYKDYNKYKIRLILLNNFDVPETLDSKGKFVYDKVNDSAYGGKQLKWLAEKALILPDNTWQVIIFQHACISGSFDDISQINTKEFVKIINAFQVGNLLTLSTAGNGYFDTDIKSDFSNQGAGTIIAVVSGHKHEDGIMDYSGIKCVQSLASFCHKGDIGREVNTYTEDAWDVLSVYTEQRKVHIYRFGAGSDRDFNY